ncbi:uncharacterized protein LOC118299797 isoform X2 [Scophthalmus maximus]|uniref:uncharacterized protein LOC118299797 isoform X2 n=1 Tax=Scophthalmus maximus TaxID=52904 RepID=UPI0015E06BAD|nr:uncharacterized protein LOC118299797 isoform X2 [Scophthalmus maximus]XP_035479712.1 uncharacterized protein LOC118299797 isoform X2 [Scophthalmus maximus]
MHNYERELVKVQAERDELLGQVKVLRKTLQKQLRSRTSTTVENQEDECVEEAGPSSAMAEQAGPSTFSPWSSGSGRGNLMRRITLPASMEEYLQTYRAHHEGLDPMTKMKENAVSKMGPKRRGGRNESHNCQNVPTECLKFCEVQGRNPNQDLPPHPHALLINRGGTEDGA